MQLEVFDAYALRLGDPTKTAWEWADDGGFDRAAWCSSCFKTLSRFSLAVLSIDPDRESRRTKTKEKSHVIFTVEVNADGLRAITEQISVDDVFVICRVAWAFFL